MRGQPDCDQTADEQQVQDKNDPQAGLQESRRMLSRPLRLDASPTQAGIAPSSACVCGLRPQRQAPSHDQDETAAANLLRESSRPSRGTRGKVTFSRIALSVTLLQS